MSYTQAEKQLYDAFNELKFALDNPDLKKIFQKVEQHDLNERMNGHLQANEKRRLNDKIINRLYTYLINGFNALRAKKQLCIEFEQSFEYIDALVTPYITRFKSDIKPEQAFAAEKMLAAGISKKKVAELLAISPPTLNNILNAQKPA